MTLWLVRHATPLVAAGVCYGRTDLPADAAHTLAVAHELADELPRGIALACSPLRRCTQLADELLALRPDLAARRDARLREFDFGAWEGRTWDAIAAAEIDAWRDAFADHAPGGGESVRAFMARVAQAFDEHCEPAVWITHAGVMRAVQLLARGIRCPATAREWPAEPIGYGRTLAVGG